MPFHLLAVAGRSRRIARRSDRRAASNAASSRRYRHVACRGWLAMTRASDLQHSCPQDRGPRRGQHFYPALAAMLGGVTMSRPALLSISLIPVFIVAEGWGAFPFARR